MLNYYLHLLDSGKIYLNGTDEHLTQQLQERGGLAKVVTKSSGFMEPELVHV